MYNWLGLIRQMARTVFLIEEKLRVYSPREQVGFIFVSFHFFKKSSHEDTLPILEREEGGRGGRRKGK